MKIYVKEIRYRNHDGDLIQRVITSESKPKKFDYEGKRLDIPEGKFNYSRSGDE